MNGPHDIDPPDTGARRSDEETYPELGEGKTGSFIADRIAPLLREPTLGPIWLVALAHFAAFGAWSLVLAVQEGRVVGLAGAFGLFWLTGTAGVAEIRQTGRPGPLCVAVGVLWGLTALFFFAARHWQII